MTAPSFMTAIEDPSRFLRSCDVALYFGLTSRRIRFLDRRSGAHLEAGDADVRRAL
ncbi:hypothetical protein [Mesorhizobium sp. M0767]|uniref:hypothetical protein n=1 Tax=unclassified Mesorhizobium TaxID=325217 RepID=UPI00333514B9